MKTHAFDSTLVALAVFCLAGVLMPEDAAAEADASAEASESFFTWGAGGRVGGYGFRDVDEEGSLRWDDCRMNGVGLFATLDFGEYLFAELSGDYYHATGDVIAAGMDRQSLFVLGAGGLRLYPDFFISPYIQVGAGSEWTKVTMASSTKAMVMPTAFAGFGGELDLWGLKLGSHVRFFAMAEPVHGGAPGGHHHGPTLDLDGGPIIEMEYEVAAQAQFFVRREF